MAASDTSQTAPPQAAGTFAALALPRFRRFWTGTMLSNLGTWMQSIAQGWLILQLTDSPMMLGVVGFAQTVPSLLLNLFGGVIADRYDRRAVCFAGQSTSMLAALLLAGLIYHSLVQPWHIIALALVNGIAWAMSGASFHSIVGDLAGRELRSNAIALNSMQFHLSRSLGPSIAGVVLAQFGAAVCFYGNSLSYLAILYALLMMGPMPPDARPTGGALQQIKEGLRYTTGNRLFVGLLAHTVVIAGMGMPIQSLLPVVARDVLHVGASGLGYLMAASGLGSVCGALMVARLSSAKGRGRRVVLMGLLYAATMVALGLSDSPMLAMAMLGVGGAASVASQATVNTLIQSLCSETMRGRVLSIYNLSFVGAMPLGNLLGGWLAQHHGAPVAITVLGTAMLVLISVIALTLPVRQVS
jgi:MFS family permease